MAIRVLLSRKDKIVQARNGKDAAIIVRNEIDRRWAEDQKKAAAAA